MCEHIKNKPANPPEIDYWFPHVVKKNNIKFTLNLPIKTQFTLIE
jgi:hypothetical protein